MIAIPEQAKRAVAGLTSDKQSHIFLSEVNIANLPSEHMRLSPEIREGRSPYSRGPLPASVFNAAKAKLGERIKAGQVTMIPLKTETADLDRYRSTSAARDERVHALAVRRTARDTIRPNAPQRPLSPSRHRKPEPDPCPITNPSIPQPF